MPKPFQDRTISVSLDFKHLNPRIDGSRVTFEVPHDSQLEELLENVPDRDLRCKLFDCAYEHNVLKTLKGVIL